MPRRCCSRRRRLELHVAHIDKMVRAHMLPPPIASEAVEGLVNRPRLEVVEGELAVLRTDAREDANPEEHATDPRRLVGFSVDHTDQELEDTSLRWWRSDPDRVVENRLFVVTIGTFPVAAYDITKRLDTQVRAGETKARHHYAGKLLARVTAGMKITYAEPLSGELQPLVHQLMESRVEVSSGGPIGYLEPRHSAILDDAQ